MIATLTSHNSVSEASQQERVLEPQFVPISAQQKRTVSIAVLQMAILLESYKIFKEMTRDDWTWIRDFAESQVMALADKTEKERVSQSLWTLVGGVAAGVLKVGSAVALGVSAAKPDVKWLEAASKGTYAFGEIGSAVAQGGASLQGAHAGKTEALYEASKRLEDSLEKMRQASQSGDQMVLGIIDQLIRGWQQRSI